MSGEKQSIWKSPWVGRRKVIMCFVLLASVFFLTFSPMALMAEPALTLTLVFTNALIYPFALSLAVLTALFLIRWLWSWRNLRRTLLGLAGLATLIAIFLCRGKLARQKGLGELQTRTGGQRRSARLERLHPCGLCRMSKIFKAPKIQEWFVGRNITNYPGLGFSLTHRRKTRVP